MLKGPAGRPKVRSHKWNMTRAALVFQRGKWERWYGPIRLSVVDRFFIVSPLRRLGQNPQSILEPYISPGMTAVDIGCGMGFFSLEMARLAGPEGRIVCVDLQPKMIKSLVKRAEKEGLIDRIDGRSCSVESLGLDDLKGSADFVLLFAVVHEVPDKELFLSQTASLLKPGGILLLAEPPGHVSKANFKMTVGIMAVL